MDMTIDCTAPLFIRFEVVCMHAKILCVNSF